MSAPVADAPAVTEKASATLPPRRDVRAGHREGLAWPLPEDNLIAHQWDLRMNGFENTGPAEGATAQSNGE